jgi:hypothetical protein
MAGLTTKGRMEITGLDFDDIKRNLKTYLRGQSKFTDYDFEGSGMSILLDTLAYNTHYTAFYANMLANEMFLNTSQKRNSVTSHAKALGYVPTSAKAPTASVRVEVNDANTATTTMPEGYVFTTTINGIDYQFVNTEDRSVNPIAGQYIFGPINGISVYEGTWVTTKYTVNSTDVDQRFIIPNENADLSTLKVLIQTSDSDSTQVGYTKSSSLVSITANTTAYFCQETVDNQWEIYFGDSVVGKSLIDGNIVILKYVVTNVTEANGANVFLPSTSISGFNNITVTTLSSASGGAEKETEDSIKFNAPFSYAAQNRAVTAKDYAVIVPTIYPNVESISVWGGEFADPAVYGKVYISIKTKTGYSLTTSAKADIVTQLENYNVASITPVVLVPETTKIIPTVNFKFNDAVTDKSVADLVTLIKSRITTWSDDILEKHEAIFRYSPFVGLVDDTDTSLLSNITTIKLSKTFLPVLGESTKYTISFENDFYHPYDGYLSTTAGTEPGGVVESSGFTITGDINIYTLEDNGKGDLNAFYISSSNKVYLATSIGTVDYIKGEVVVTSMDISGVEDYDGLTQTELRITVRPSSNDIVPVRNQILEIDLINVSVSGEADVVAAGSSDGGTTYATSSSYS